MGVERKSMIVTRRRRSTSRLIHEAGHALVAALIPQADPLHKVTIIPRGMALGLTMQLPPTTNTPISKDFLAQSPS
jgi:cell division protease FtsH